MIEHTPTAKLTIPTNLFTLLFNCDIASIPGIKSGHKLPNKTKIAGKKMKIIKKTIPIHSVGVQKRWNQSVCFVLFEETSSEL